MEGYDVEVVGEVPIDLYCTICLKLMCDAIQMKCGHGMCEACFKKLADSCKERNIQITCPSCRHVVPKWQALRNWELDRVINAVKVKCSNHKLGCQWVGELQSSNNHVEVCEYYPMKCKNEICSELIPRCKIEEHLQLDCLYDKIKCSFRSIGCCVEFLRKDFNDHLHEFNQKHMLLLLQNTCEKEKHIEGLQEESKVVAQNAVEIEKRLLTKIDELEKKIHEIKNNSVVINGRLDEYKAQYENVLSKLVKIEQKFQDLPCFAPHKLTGSEDSQNNVIAAERNESSMAMNYPHVEFSDGICDVQKLNSIARETFEEHPRASIDVLLETFKSESKTPHEQWLSNDIKSLCGVSEMNKAGLPSSEAYIRIIIDAVNQSSKISNFQQISRMEKYCHLLSSKKMFENGRNTVQMENHSFVRYQYSLLMQNNWLTVNVGNHTVALCKTDLIFIFCEKVKEIYIINRHLQKNKLTCHANNISQWYTVSYNDLVATEYVVNDWFLLEIVWQM